jgi:uncharacterized protein YbjQ (UPF0145 family)
MRIGTAPCIRSHGRSRGTDAADAIIGMRYDAAEFVEGATEVLAYGTAVKLSS